MLCDFGVTTNIPGFSVPEVPGLPLPRCLSCQQQRAKDLWHSYGIAVPSQSMGTACRFASVLPSAEGLSWYRIYLL